MSSPFAPRHIIWPADNQPSERWPIYTRGNIGEVYPDVVLPLEWDLAGIPSELGWRRGAEEVGFLTEDDYGPDEHVIVAVFGGYAYFNASVMRLLGVRTPGLAVDVIDTQFLGEADVPGYRPRPGDKNLRATARVLATAAKTLTAKKVPRLDEMRAKVDAYRASAPPMDAPNKALWQYVTNGLDELWEYLIASHVMVTMQATIAAGALTDLCEAKLGDPNLAVALTTGIGDVVSAEPARAMWELANETEDGDYPVAFEAFLQRHGHRGPNEFSLAGRDWAAFPQVAQSAIDLMRGLDPDRSPQRQYERMVTQRQEAMAVASERMGWQRLRLEKAVTSTALWSQAREVSKDQVIRGTQLGRHAFLELLRRARERGGVDDTIGPLLLGREEFLRYLEDPPAMVALIEERRSDYLHLAQLEPPFAFDAKAHASQAPSTSTWSQRQTDASAAQPGEILTGAAGAPGKAVGKARIVHDPGDPTALEPGEVLVAALTDPSWTPLFVAAAGVVVEVGAAMSHSMIVSRELGIPCVVGVENATRRLTDGATVEIDGGAGTVTIV